MKRVFISHPNKDDPMGNKKRVDTICRELAEYAQRAGKVVRMYGRDLGKAKE